MKKDKDQQYKHFDDQLRKFRSTAEKWETKYNLVNEENGKLKQRISDSNDSDKSAAKRSKHSILTLPEYNSYGIASILHHRKKNNQMFYFVHWEGYDFTHDSWVHQSDLKCAVK